MKGFSIPFLNFQSNGEQRLVQIKIPKGQVDFVKVISNIGQIHIETIHTKSLHAESDIGEILIDQFRGEKADIKTNIGKININSAVGKMNVSTDKGQISLTLDEMVEDVYLMSNIGEINVNILHVPDHITFDLSTNLGEISVNGFDNVDGSSRKMVKELSEGGPILFGKTEIGKINIQHE
ncbi:DUF4097 family beta strand repeat-containing protein [Salirhabdus salicampi]|uniref:DUF4097 family beta strand repeat-containing protein n=1 Tax=Salirhabdus salicampi TaxID=476102 RepID=UPI0034633BDF